MFKCGTALVIFAFINCSGTAHADCEQASNELTSSLTIFDQQLATHERAIVDVLTIPVTTPVEDALYTVFRVSEITLTRYSALNKQELSILPDNVIEAIEAYRADPTLENAIVQYMSRIALPHLGEVMDLADDLRESQDLRSWKNKALAILQAGHEQMVNGREANLRMRAQLDCVVSDRNEPGMSVSSGDETFDQFSHDGNILIFTPEPFGTIIPVLDHLFGGHYGKGKNGIIFDGDRSPNPHGFHGFQIMGHELTLFEMPPNTSKAYIVQHKREGDVDVVYDFKLIGEGRSLVDSMYGRSFKAARSRQFGSPQDVGHSVNGATSQIIVFQKNEQGVLSFRQMSPRITNEVIDDVIDRARHDVFQKREEIEKQASRFRKVERDKYVATKRKAFETYMTSVENQQNGLLRDQGLFPSGEDGLGSTLNTDGRINPSNSVNYYINTACESEGRCGFYTIGEQN